MNRSGTSPLHTPGTVRPGRKIRGQSRAGAHGSFASGATTESCAGSVRDEAVQSPENDGTVSRPSHSRAARRVSARGGHGNGASMQGSENGGTVSRPSHSRLQNTCGVSHIPTPTGGCGCVYSVSGSRARSKSKTCAVQAVRAGCECKQSEQKTPALLAFTPVGLSHGRESCCAREGRMTFHPLEGCGIAESGDYRQLIDNTVLRSSKETIGNQRSPIVSLHLEAAWT